MRPTPARTPRRLGRLANSQRAQSRPPVSPARAGLALADCFLLLAALVGPGIASAADLAQSATSGLRADCFANDHLGLPIELTRTDGTIDFAYGAGSPDPSLPPDEFSARWSG